MQTKPLIIIICTTIILGSCAPAYIPNVINSPLFTEKADIAIAAYSGSAGFDIQTAGAVTDHIGLMINGSYDDRTNDTLDWEKYHKHSFIEFAPGYFTKIGNNKVVEIYAGYGIGNVKTDFDEDYFASNVNADLSRFFIQPGFGFVNNFINWSLSTRFTRVTVKQNRISETGYFAEPAFTLKAGYKWAMACFQIGLTVPFDNNTIHFQYQPTTMSLGLQFNLGRVLKKN